MTLSRIILTIVIITYEANAAFWYDKITNKYTVSADEDDSFDDLGLEYDGEEYDSTNEDLNNISPDYSENGNDILVRQLPESGEAKTKKSQTWCKIKKVTKYHNENGYEFFPKSYTEYDCIPYFKHGGYSDNSIYSHDVCLVKDVKCKPLQKTLVYFKRPHNSPCLLMKEEKTVNVGCNCINHVKYHFH